MATLATITITIKVDAPKDVIAPAVRIDAGRGSGGPEAQTDDDAEAIKLAVQRLAGRISRRFLREVAAAGMNGSTVTVTRELGRSYDLDDGGSLGGAIAVAATSLYNATGKTRWPLDRISQSPSIWRMSERDARIVLAALDESDQLHAG